MRIRDMVEPTYLYKDGKSVCVDGHEVLALLQDGWIDSPIPPAEQSSADLAEPVELTPAEARAARRAERAAKGK